MSSVLKGLLTKAERAARRRNQRSTTGHALLIMLQSGGPASRVLAQAGVREGDLLGALRIVASESESTLEVAVERSLKIAAQQGTEADELHLLLSICRDVCSSGYRCLDVFAGRPQAVRQNAESALGIVTAPPQDPKKSEAASAQDVDKKPPLGARPPGRAWTADLNRAAKRAHKVRPSTEVPTKNFKKPDNAQDKKSRRPSARRDPKGLASTFATPGDQEAASDLSELVKGNPFELDPRRFPLLTSLGRNLSAEAFLGLLDPIFDREEELELLLDVLGRRKANNPMLVGPPGVGKTALVEGLAIKLAAETGAVHALSSRILVEISAGALVSGTAVRGALSDRMRQLQEEVLELDGRVVLFIDEIHVVVGGGGPDDLATELKTMLTQGTLPCIGATTDVEFRKHFEKDAALLRRFSPVRVNEPTPKVAKKILRRLIEKYERHHGVAYADEAIDAAVDLSVRYLTERQLPDKAIGVLDQAGAQVARKGLTAVRPDAVADVIAKRTDVPKARLLGDDQRLFLDLDDALRASLVGQDAAIERISETLRLGAAGLRAGRPLGTFLLLGPTGVGKTEMAKAVATAVFPASVRLGTPSYVRFDMSEFSEAHSVARLFGAPPGYVGHDSGGQLTEAVRRRPYQLILLDEVEKAHPDVLMALLPLLDEGRLTDGRGRTVDFTHTIIFMTSNLGVGGGSTSRIGFGSSAPASADSTGVLERARASLPPELWNRIDEPLVFTALDQKEVATIAERMIGGIATKLLESKGIHLAIDESTIETLISSGGYDRELGARPMRRTIGRLLEAPLAKLVLRGDVGAGDVIEVCGDGGRLTLQRVDPFSDSSSADFGAATYV